MIDVARTVPRVSLLTCTYNRRQYLPSALRCSVRQTWPNLQIIVVNDGGESVRDIVESFHDPRIVLIDREDNRGKAASLNEAIALADGKYIAYLDDDDIHYPDHIETLRAQALRQVAPDEARGARH